MQRTAVPVFMLLGLLACASNVWVKSGATTQDFNKDSYECEKDSRQSGYYGGGITGSINMQEFFNKCMVAHGWTLQQQQQQERQTEYSNPSPRPAATTTKSTSPYTGKVTISLPDGWEQKALNESMVIGNGILYAINRTTDTGVLLSATKREGITDLMEFANASRANQANRLTDPQQSEISQIEIGGRKALRFDVTGVLKSGLKVTYMMTVIEGSTEIAIVNTWAAAANFERQKKALALLTENVSGL